MSGLVEFTTFEAKVINTPAVTADSLILLTVQATTGPTAPAAVVVSRVPGVSFTIRSGRSGDTMSVGWIMLD